MPNWNYGSLNFCVTSQVGFKTSLSFVGKAQHGWRKLDCSALPRARSSPGTPLKPAPVLHNATHILHKCWSCQKEGLLFYIYTTFAAFIRSLAARNLDLSQLPSQYSSLTPRPGRTLIGVKLPTQKTLKISERHLIYSPMSQVLRLMKKYNIYTKWKMSNKEHLNKCIPKYQKLRLLLCPDLSFPYPSWTSDHTAPPRLSRWLHLAAYMVFLPYGGKPWLQVLFLQSSATVLPAHQPHKSPKAHAALLSLTSKTFPSHCSPTCDSSGFCET